MKSIEDLILDAVDNRFKVLEKRLKYDQTYYGKVKTVNGKKVTVTINESDYICEIKSGIKVVVGDVVIVKSPNGNFSLLYIDGKLGDVEGSSLAELQNEINDLSSKSNLSTYNSYRQLKDSKFTTIEDLVRVMPNNSIFIGDAQGNFLEQSIFPTGSGLVRVSKINDNRCYLEYFESTTYTHVATTWYSWYRDLEVVKYQWQQLATAKKTEILLDNNWENYSNTAGGFALAYAYRCGNTVQLNGLIRRGIQDNNTIIGRLPLEYRPSEAILTYIHEAGTWARIDVGKAGDIRLTAKSNTLRWIDLSQISFGIQGGVI